MEHIRILGSRAALTDYSEVMHLFDRWISEGGAHQVCIANVHTTVLGSEDEKFQKVTNSAGLVTMDGKPLVWAAKLKGNSNASRVSGPDLMMKVFEVSEKNQYRHFLYGGAAGVPEKLKEILETRFPGVKIVGVYSPPYRELTTEEDNAVVSMINAANPDFLWVGLGAPKQENFIHDHLDRIDVPVQLGVGAAFDFLGGAKKNAPRWMQKIGMEWALRLVSEPKRLWKRYLMHNPRFIVFFIRQWLREKKKNDSII